jgi:hypothetical protein
LWLHNGIGIRNLLLDRYRPLSAIRTVAAMHAFFPLDARFASATRLIGSAFGRTVRAGVLGIGSFDARGALRPARLAVVVA